MKNVLAVLSLTLLLSCQQKSNNDKSSQINFLQSQINHWKEQLLINGDVGTPCSENPDNWSADNPERFYGLPKDAVKYKVFDANKDSIDDYLLYFSAGDCCSCEVGMNQASDFVKLIYSIGDTFLNNDNLREKIASKIETEFYTQYNIEVTRAIFSLTDFEEDISGTYDLWTNDDPDCCPSKKGNFIYNPFTFQIQITLNDEK